MCIYFVYSFLFICRWTLRLFPYLVYCKLLHWTWECIISDIMILFPLNKYTEVGLLYYMVGFLCLFLVTAMLFFYSVWTNFTFPPPVHKGFLFTTSLLTLVPWLFFYGSHSNWCKVVSHCVFFLMSSPHWLVILNICSCNYQPFICHLWKNMFDFPVH